MSDAGAWHANPAGCAKARTKRPAVSVVHRYARALVAGKVVEGFLEEDAFVAGDIRHSLDQVRLVAPCRPTKIIGVGRNYAEHAAEFGTAPPPEPLLFFKPPSAVTDPDADVVYPRQTRRVDFEGELAVVIGVRCKAVRADEAEEVIAGYTICNDLTARDLQRSDGQWARAKGFDGFAPLGPCIVAGLDPRRLRLQTFVNGRKRQDASVADLTYSVPQLVEYISAAFTLEPGDVISTGTPAGVGPLQPQDVVEVVIDPIGILRNRIVAPAS